MKKMTKNRQTLAAVGIALLLTVSARAEMRGAGPFVGYVARADNGALYLLDGVNPLPLAQPDHDRLAAFANKAIQFYAAPNQWGFPFESITNITPSKIYSSHKTPILGISFQQESTPFPSPIHFDLNFIRGPQGVYSPDTKYVHAAIWGSPTGIPRIVRRFSINRAWGAGYDQTDMLKESPFTRSVNVLLPPGEYALVLEGVVDDRPRGSWSGGRFLLSAPALFRITPNSDTNAVKTVLFSWLDCGPVSERVAAAQSLVNLGEDSRPYARILDDLETEVFDQQRCDAISFLSQHPTPEVLKALRVLILRERTDLGIENILSCIPTDNRPSRRPPAITQLLISMLSESRLVDAAHSSLSHVRVSDCIAAWLAATTHGSEFFKNTTVEERDRRFSAIVEDARKRMSE